MDTAMQATADADAAAAASAAASPSLAPATTAASPDALDVDSSLSSVSSVSAPSFALTLYSDVDPAKSLSLWHRAWALDPLLAEVMGPVDGTCGAHVLSACMSVLVFSAGERIIAAGEDATFAALVLEGDVRASAPGVVVSLPTGSWVGEMALLEGGKRSADIDAQDQGAVLAVLSYEDLDRLPLLSAGTGSDAAAHDLKHKLTMMLAMTALKKLRNMMDKPAAGTHTGDEAATTTATATAAAAPATPLKGPLHAAPTRKTAAAKESLFVSRLAKQAAQTSAAAADADARTKAEVAALKSLVSRREAEAQYAKDNVKHRLSKLDKELADAQAKTATLTKLLAGEKKKRAEAEGTLAHLRDQHAQALAEATSSRVMGREEWEAKSHDLAMQLLQSEQARSKRELEYSPLIESLKAQIREAQGLIEAQTMQMTQKDAATSAHADTIAVLESKQKGLESDLCVQRDRVCVLDTEKGHLVYRLNALLVRNESLECEVHSWRRKSADYLDNYEKLLLKYRKDISDISKEKASALSSHRTMHKLVRSLSLKLYVRNWRLRRWIFNLHLMVSTIIVKQWEEAIGDAQREANSFWKAAGTGAPAAAAKGATAGPSDAVSSLYLQLQQAAAREKRMSAMIAETAPAAGGPSAASASSVLSPTASMSVLPSPLIGQPAQPPPLAAPFPLSSVAAPSPTAGALTQLSTLAYTAPGETQHCSYSSLRADKKRYLHSLRARRPPLLFLLQSLQDELIDLRSPVDALSATVKSLRANLDSFFQRNIQLTAALANTRKALDVARASYEQIRAALSRRAHADTSVNPLTHNALLSDSRPHTAGAAAASTASVHPSHRDRQHSFGSGGGGGALASDEEKDSMHSSGAAVPTIAAAIAAAASGTSAPSPSPPPSARRPGSSGGSACASSPGSVDWAALDCEKSSGYGVTRPRVRREARIAPGLGHKTAAAHSAQRRPSRMQVHTAPLTPHPPHSPHAAGAAFLPRVTTPAQ